MISKKKKKKKKKGLRQYSGRFFSQFRKFKRMRGALFVWGGLFSIFHRKSASKAQKTCDFAYFTSQWGGLEPPPPPPPGYATDGGTLNFPLGEAKSQWEDANYRWEDVSLILLKYWLYFHLQVKPLHHYCNTDTVRNQHQLLTCQTSKWQSLLF